MDEITPALLPPGFTSALPRTIADRLCAAGLMARLRADQPVDLLLEVGDALLAAPVLVVEIPIHHPEAAALVEAFRDRFGDHLLVGVGAITTIQEGTMALAAGADFLITTRYASALHKVAEQCGALYVPPAPVPAALPALHAMGVLMVTATTTTLLAAAHNTGQMAPGVLATEVRPETIAAVRRAGAAAVAVGDLLFPTAAWSMPTLIRTARALRHQWLAGEE
jgi:2-keto-3-deoxy-6-phosphogluconate aldolase